MNILYVTYGLPYPPNSGARIRDYNLIKRVAQSHDVSLLCLLENTEERQHLAALEPICKTIVTVIGQRGTAGSLWHAASGLIFGRPAATATFWFPDLAARLCQLSSEEDFDLIQIEHSFLAVYIDAIAPGSNAKTVLSMHNIGAVQYQRNAAISTGPGRIAAAIKSWLMRDWEVSLARRFDHVIAVSRHDWQMLRQAGLDGKVSVIENGVDCAALALLDTQDMEKATLLFIGTMGYLPNRDAVNWFCSEVLPILEQTVPGLRMIAAGSGGKRFLSELEARIEVSDRIDDVVPLYRRAHVVVVPLRTGGGSRLKILEAMALGRPVVSTPVGCEGLELETNSDLAVADTPQAFADEVERLIGDEAAWKALRRSARHTVEQQYDWPDIAERLLALYAKICGIGPCRPTHQTTLQNEALRSTQTPRISVVIPVFNSESTLPGCLSALEQSHFRHFETIIVDDGSTDGSVDIARKRCDHFHSLDRNRGAASARNRGAQMASGEVLFFLDADILVTPQTLDQVWSGLDQECDGSPIDGLFCAYQHDTVAKNFWSQYKNLLHHYTHQVSDREAVTFCGGYGALRRSVFEAVGGYDESLRVMEDVDLGYRLHRAGKRIRLMPRIQLTHTKRYTFWSLTASDLFNRAIPWTKIMLRRRMFKSDLNLRSNRMASVMVVYLMLASFLLMPELPWVPMLLTAIGLVIVLIALNHRFLTFCARMRDRWFAARVLLMSVWVYFYSGIGFLLGVLAWLRDTVFGEGRTKVTLNS